MGMGMLFQNPPEIDGLPLSRLIDHAFGDNEKECGTFMEGMIHRY